MISIRSVTSARPAQSIFSRGVRGDTQHVDVAGTGLDHEEDVQAPQGRGAVDVEEVACQRRVCLGPQELTSIAGKRQFIRL